nr:hypothetical protein [Tanacetum cinerariifolium]
AVWRDLTAAAGADDQTGGQRRDFGCLAAQLREQGADQRFAGFPRVLGHGRQRRRGQLRRGNIVEADDRDLAGHAAAERGEPA